MNDEPELPNGTVVEVRWTRPPIPLRRPKETGPVEETETLVKVDGVWYPAGVETYTFDTDDEMREHYPDNTVISWPLNVARP